MRHPSFLMYACAGLVGIGQAATAQWTSDPMANTPVATGLQNQVTPQMAAGPDGSTWVAWFQSGGSVPFEMYLQRLDENGFPMFPGGLLVSDNPQAGSLVDFDLLVDSTGAAVLVFTDIRAGADRDVYAYRISPAGEFLWGDDGITLSDNNLFEADPRVCQHEGDFVFIWPRMDDVPPNTESAVVMQRLDADGNKSFGAAGMDLVTGGSESPGFPEMVSDGSGGLIVSWVRDTATFMSPRHVYAQRFSSTGVAQWNAGAPVIVSDAASLPIAHRPRLIGDGAGGAVIAWHDTRSGVFNCYVQRLNAVGAAQFAIDGVEVSTSTPGQRLNPAISYDAAAQQVYVFFEERDNAQAARGLGAQKLGPSGARLWSDIGVVLLELGPFEIGAPTSVQLGASAICIVQRGNIGDDEIFGFRLDSAGTDLWGPNFLISSVDSDKLRRQLVIHGDGACVYGWEDLRAGNSDIYVQRIRPDGTLGGSGCPADWNNDTVVNSGDFFDFIADFVMGDADYNGDTVTNSGDFFDFIAAFITVCA